MNNNKILQQFHAMFGVFMVIFYLGAGIFMLFFADKIFTDSISSSFFLKFSLERFCFFSVVIIFALFLNFDLSIIPLTNAESGIFKGIPGRRVKL